MKLWGGRFAQDQSEIMKQFNDSFRFDRLLYAVDIQGSQAYAQALHMSGLLTSKEAEQIHAGLEIIKLEFDCGEFEALPGDEDIHTAVERRLHELIGELAGKLHSGRSRNDQIALDLRLYVIGQIDQVIEQITALQYALIKKAETHMDVIMPGFTHLQPAQPVLFSHWLMSFFWMFERDKARLIDSRERTAVSPLGSGALAGNPFAIDQQKLAADLGMPLISMNSLDAVRDRDFVAEFLFVLSLAAVHISNIAEDIIIFNNPALKFVEIAEDFSTGSSLMPQKRNPDSMELARGKTGRVISALVNLLIVLKGLPSTYNKDLQEDKEALFDSIENFSLTLSVVTGVVDSLIVFPSNIEGQLNDAMLATDMADYLVESGVPFREAHQKVGEAIRYAEGNDISLSEIPLFILKEISPQFEADVNQVFDYRKAVSKRTGIGGTAPQAVARQIVLAKSKLSG